MVSDSFIILLLFPVPPYIAPLEFSDNPVNSEDMVSLLCTVTKGDFSIEINWTLEGRNVEEIPGISVMRTNKRISQLSIDSVQAQHAGEYVCAARNPAGTVSLSTVLHVNGIVHTLPFKPYLPSQSQDTREGVQLSSLVRFFH